jgi:hypothetical protein
MKSSSPGNLPRAPGDDVVEVLDLAEVVRRRVNGDDDEI